MRANDCGHVHRLPGERRPGNLDVEGGQKQSGNRMVRPNDWRSGTFFRSDSSVVAL